MEQKLQYIYIYLYVTGVYILYNILVYHIHGESEKDEEKNMFHVLLLTEILHLLLGIVYSTIYLFHDPSRRCNKATDHCNMGPKTSYKL